MVQEDAPCVVGRGSAGRGWQPAVERTGQHGGCFGPHTRRLRRHREEEGAGFDKKKPMAQRPVLTIAQDEAPHDGGQRDLNVGALAEEERQRGSYRGMSIDASARNERIRNPKARPGKLSTTVDICSKRQAYKRHNWMKPSKRIQIEGPTSHTQTEK